MDELGQGIHPEKYTRRFRELCVTAMVPKIRMHAVRHTLALMMHRAGQAPTDAASLLGHSVAVHLSGYVPRTEHGAENAASALGAVFAKAL